MGAGASSKSKWEAEASKFAVEVEKQASKDMKSVKHLSLEIKHELHTHCQQSVHEFFDLLSKSVGMLGLGDAVGVSAAFTLFGSEIEVARSPLHLGHRRANWKSLVDHPSTPPALLLRRLLLLMHSSPISRMQPPSRLMAWVTTTVR